MRSDFLNPRILKSSRRWQTLCTCNLPKKYHLRGSRNWLSFHSPTPSYSLPAVAPPPEWTWAHEDLVRPPTQKSNSMIQVKDGVPTNVTYVTENSPSVVLRGPNITCHGIRINLKENLHQNQFLTVSFRFFLSTTSWLTIIPPKLFWPNNSVRKILISTKTLQIVRRRWESLATSASKGEPQHRSWLSPPPTMRPCVVENTSWWGLTVWLRFSKKKKRQFGLTRATFW